MSRSTPPPPSLEDGKLEANGEKTRSHEPSTGTSSPVNGALEKLELSEDTAPATEEKAAETPAPPPMTYPKGIQLVGIMASLVLTIGMMSLDSASSTSPTS
jgi:hypothetical protein